MSNLFSRGLICGGALGLALCLILAVGSALRAADPPAAPAAPPAAFQSIYKQLDATLGQAEGFLKAHPADPQNKPVFNVELLVASGQRAGDLLLPRTWPGVTVTLNRLKSLGVGGVTVQIPYPLLLEEYPRYAELRAFEKRLAGEVHRQGFKLTVKMGAFFPQKEFSQNEASYSGLTLAKLQDGMARQGAWITHEMKPDFLNIISEPDTMGHNTGVELTPEAFRDLVNRVVEAARQPGVRIGAGTGSWNPPRYMELLATETKLDSLDLHVYPIQRGWLTERIPAVAELARKNGKGLTMSECWLYKAGGSDLLGSNNVAASTELFARDAWSFWMPLDERFVRDVAAYAKLYNMEYCSFFWMRNLYGYLDYTPEAARMGPARIYQELNKVAAGNIVKGQLNAVGEALRECATKK